MAESINITKDSPKSSLAEAYRMLRTNLSFIPLAHSFRSLMITSADVKEGKSTTLANLAVVMAEAGRRILIVDSDLRKPMQHSIFNLPNHQGLSNILMNNIRLPEAIQADIFPNLSVMTSGPIPPNPSELLGSRLMHVILHSLIKGFDCILFDSPPVVAVADTAILAPQVDGVILVIKSGDTKIALIKEAKAILDNAKARIVGAVLNSVKYDNHYDQYCIKMRTND